MKIIVDKMPNEPKECIFSECTNQSNYVCNLHQGRGCEPNRCNFLKTIAKNKRSECYGITCKICIH